MNATVTIYDSHAKAVKAVECLNEADFDMDKVSIVGKAEITQDHMQVVDLEDLKNAPLRIGAIAGPVIGLLTGLSVVAVPGLGFLYGAGAIVGALGGFSAGMVSGGLITLLATIGIEKESLVRYEQEIKKGRFLLTINGTNEEINHARKILETEGTHLQMDALK